MASIVGRLNYRAELILLGNNGTLINEVMLDSGVSLFGVTITAVEGDFVVFFQAGSAGTGSIIVPLEKITAFDATPILPN